MTETRRRNTPPAPKPAPPPQQREPEEPLLPVPRPPAQLTAPEIPSAARAFLRESEGTDLEQPSRIPLVTIQHSEGMFQLPTGELVDQVEGYPIKYYFTRRYYKNPPRPGQPGGPPDCWSGDMLKPSPQAPDPQNPTCAGCPNAQFGTARDGRSQACGTFLWTFLLNPEFGNPPIWAVVSPPSSLKAMAGTRFRQGYFGMAQTKHKAYQIVWTALRLQILGEGTSVQYAVLQPVMGPAADDDQATQVGQIRKRFLAEVDAYREKSGQVQVQGGEGYGIDETLDAEEDQ